MGRRPDSVDAGAVNFLVWRKLVNNNRKKIDTKKTRVFWTTPPYVDYVWVARGGVPEEVRKKFKQALLKLDYANPEHKKIMDLQRTRKFIPAKDSDWDGIKKAAIAAGIAHRSIDSLATISPGECPQGIRARAGGAGRVRPEGRQGRTGGPHRTQRRRQDHALPHAQLHDSSHFRSIFNIGGREVAELYGRRLREMRRRIGTVYQQHNLVPRLRVVHNVLSGRLGSWSLLGSLASLVRPSQLETAYRALADVGIGEKLFSRTDELSGGQQQRVAIARVLVQDPDVILADEPVSSVDPSLAENIIKLLIAISEDTRKTLLVNLHSTDLALSYFPRVVGMKAGVKLFDTAASQVTPELLRELYCGHAPENGAGVQSHEPEHLYIAVQCPVRLIPMIRCGGFLLSPRRDDL